MHGKQITNLIRRYIIHACHLRDHIYDKDFHIISQLYKPYIKSEREDAIILSKYTHNDPHLLVANQGVETAEN